MIGIYKLEFAGLEDWPYIGKSQDIEGRFKFHLNSLKRGTSNYKLQEAYEMCGEPHIEILEECTTSDLSEKEIYWITKYNSIENGLNLTAGGDSSGSGYNHARSKFTREQLINALNLLTNPDNTFEDIASLTGVTTSQVWQISCGRSHQWLYEEFPTICEIVYSINRRKGKFESQVEPVTLISPTGLEYTVKSVSELPAEYRIHYSQIHDVMTGKARQHHGWTLKDNPLQVIVFKSPLDTLYAVKERGLSSLAKKFHLTLQSLCLVAKGHQKTHKGWSLATAQDKDTLVYGD